MEIKNKNFLVVGLGMSGAAVARFLKNNGARVTVTDMAGEDKLGSYLPQMREMGIRTELGVHHIETFEGADGIVISPGVPHTIEPIEAAQSKGVPVMGEVELASRFIQEPIVAITGTNGKTTVTTLVGKMLEASGLRVFVGGNIGNPLIAYAESDQKADVVVAEISSFQLDTIDTFRPKVAVLLNITPDHLDRYPDFNGYARSKTRIFENQQADDFAVLNRKGSVVLSVTDHIKSWVLDAGHWVLDAGRLVIETPRSLQPATRFMRLLPFNIPKSLRGKHNLENLSAACLASLAAGGTPEGIQAALDNFKGLPHRIEYVDTVNNIRYFDDSKATNPDAVAKALENFDGARIILIMGGRNKGYDFSMLKDSVRRYAKQLIVIGEATAEIISALKDAAPTAAASTMEDAVLQAHRAAQPGDVVLLSPACSSFDMYRNYAERGEDFCRAVRGLKN